MTEENIIKISKQVMKEIEKSDDNLQCKQLSLEIKNNKRKIANLINAVSECELDSVRKSLYIEIQNLENANAELEKELLSESHQLSNIDEKQIQFFLSHIKKGNIDDVQYKKMLINILINRIYLFDDKLIIYFNIQGKPVQINKLLVENVEKVLLMGTGLHHNDF